MMRRVGRCHCGGVRFAVEMPSDARPHYCNCSMCALKGSLAIDVPIAALTVLEGEQLLGCYSFGTEWRSTGSAGNAASTTSSNFAPIPRNTLSTASASTAGADLISTNWMFTTAAMRTRRIPACRRASPDG